MTLDTRTPHVDPAWAQAFVLELRLRDVPGAGIGAALAEVESHCAESGESASEAFGDPVDYARELGLSGTPPSRRELARPIASALLGVVGMLAAVQGLSGVLSGGLVHVTSGMLTCLVVVALAIGWLWLDVDRACRWLVDHPVLIGGFWFALLAVQVAVMLLWRTQVGAIAALPLLVGGVVLVVASSAAELGAGRADDPITGPPRLGGVGSDARPRGPLLAVLAGPLLLPVATAVMLLATWAIARVAG